ncbi:MAG: MauE/DoxX family redox-associated membrane protein [Bacteroidota bacterium]
MTFIDIFIRTGSAGLILTILLYFFNKPKGLIEILVEFIKNWIGALFIFSGFVKAIDPIGTGIKIGEYFEVLHMKFLEPFSLEFSIFMIVLEIVLGVALIIGWQRFFTTAISYLMMIFFTFLTGFTYVTAYCPSTTFFVLCGIVLAIITVTAFFQDKKLRIYGIAATIIAAIMVFAYCKFSGHCLLCAYDEANMKVTSCGCFGDFIKLKPLQSFKKDLILIVMMIFLLFNYKKIKSPFTNGKLKWVAVGIIAIVAIATWLFCLNNYKWNEPFADFRPYKIGTNIIEDRKTKKAPVIDYVFNYKNKTTGKIRAIGMKQLATAGLTEADSFVSREEKIIDPGIPAKILDFAIYDKPGGTEVTEDILGDPAYTFLIVSYDIKKANKEAYTKKINPLVIEANKNGCNTIVLSSNATDQDMKAMHTEAYLYWADDVFLKTIGRGNPVILLIKDGVILNKWHWNHLPTFDAIKKAHIKS